MDAGMEGLVSAPGVTCTWVVTDTEGMAGTGDREEGPGHARRSFPMGRFQRDNNTERR